MGSNRGPGLTLMELEEKAQLVSMKNIKCYKYLHKRQGKVPPEKGHKLNVSDLRRKERKKKGNQIVNKHTK